MTETAVDKSGSRPRWTAEALGQLTRMLQQGASNAAIAQAVGHSPGAVASVIRRAGLHRSQEQVRDACRAVAVKRWRTWRLARGPDPLYQGRRYDRSAADNARAHAAYRARYRRSD